MSGSSNSKQKLLYLLKILSECTDEETRLTSVQIVEKLNAYGIAAERKSVSNDIQVLQDFGYDIEGMGSGSRGCYLASRDFEIAELKLLVDAVQSSRFITRKKSGELIKKLEALTSTRLAGQLQRQVFVLDRVKCLNEQVYYNVDTLYAAIASGRQISFKYFDYNIEKKRCYRDEGRLYIASPYGLTWSDDNYYLIAYSNKRQEVVNYRVDRMEKISLLKDVRIPVREATGDDSFNVATYAKKLFSMYGGEEQNIRLRCKNDNKLVNAVLDRFGADVRIMPDGDDHFILSSTIQVSPPFLGWLFQFGGGIEVLSPECVRTELLKMAEDLKAQYGARGKN